MGAVDNVWTLEGSKWQEEGENLHFEEIKELEVDTICSTKGNKYEWDKPLRRILSRWEDNNESYLKEAGY